MRLVWPTQLLLILALSTAAFASRERTEVGHNISVGPDEEISEATCFGCTVRVRGHVAGDVTTFGGSIIVEQNGQIDGDATTFAGSIRLEKEVEVNGDVTVFGGRLHREPTAKVGGDIANFGGGGWILLSLIVAVPVVFFGFLVVGIIWLVRRLLRPAPIVA
jgi:cytoskeletal protein CcmA (bactofilin family)